MSRFDSNPFDEESGKNPYAGSGEAAAPAPSSGSFFSKMTPSFGKSAFSASAADAATVPATPEALARKEKELDALEQSLRRKEQEVIQQEAQAGVEHKNFPPFFPLIHHDIRNDIPDNRKSIMRMAFFSWMGIMLCLVFNLVGAIASWIQGTFSFTDGIGNFFLALIYLILGVPGSYLAWYRPLYIAMKKQGYVSYTMFFIGYAVHIAFCIFATIAPPFLWHGYSFTGFMAAFNILANGWTVIGIIYLVGAALFACETTLSIVVIGRVFAHFRGRA